MSSASEMMGKVRDTCPLVHHITNYVTVNDCANMCICAGGSPVMSDAAEDVPDMVRIASAVVLNIGTLNPRTVESMILAGRTANEVGIPVVLDPVGVGATPYRTETAERILREVKVSVIKGNHGEISVLAGLGGEVRGVDSRSSGDDMSEAVARLAERTGTVVAATGPVDYVSDGRTVAVLSNGSAMMSTVSGTGCMVSSVVGAYVGACGVSVDSVAAAISVVNIASEVAVSGRDVSGPASFRTMLLDSVHSLRPEDVDRLIRRE
ncbi:MAG: hydroxyethylthiazole kinase [archaeon]|nr:hydroxyethylthiazole kinase [archaeon]